VIAMVRRRRRRRSRYVSLACLQRAAVDGHLELLGLDMLEINAVQLRPIIALPFIFDTANLALEHSAVVADARHSASALAIPVEFGPDRVESSSLKHFEFLVTPVLPCHAAKDTGMEVDTHTDTAI